MRYAAPLRSPFASQVAYGCGCWIRSGWGCSAADRSGRWLPSREGRQRDWESERGLRKYVGHSQHFIASKGGGGQRTVAAIGGVRRSSADDPAPRAPRGPPVQRSSTDDTDRTVAEVSECGSVLSPPSKCGEDREGRQGHLQRASEPVDGLNVSSPPRKSVVDLPVVTTHAPRGRSIECRGVRGGCGTLPQRRCALAAERRPPRCSANLPEGSVAPRLRTSSMRSARFRAAA